MMLLFLHGADGYDDDLTLARNVAAALGTPLTYPRLPTEMTYGAWADAVGTALDGIGVGDAVVAHSFGASILVRVLAERDARMPVGALLLGMPDWGPDGWAVEEFAVREAPPQHLSLHHCRDDEIVPFAHLALNAARLPRSAIHAHDAGGHQFLGLAEAIAADASSPARG